jgi:hypothetical protein
MKNLNWKTNYWDREKVTYKGINVYEFINSRTSKIEKVMVALLDNTLSDEQYENMAFDMLGEKLGAPISRSNSRNWYLNDVYPFS